MKHTKKLLAAVMALTMVSALAPMSAFAADDTIIKQDTADKTGTMTATYDVTAKYTVTIPAGIELKSDASVSKDITASDVVLESGKKIKVTLTKASNTASGSSFSAKNDKGDSTATYTISKGETAVAVGDVVAEFTENGTQALTFSKAEGATYAGTHTETLTFGISVEDAVTTPTVGTVFPIGTADLGDYYYWNHEIRADELRMKFKNFGTATISVGDNYSHPSLGNYRVISINSPTAQAIDWEQTQMDPTGPWAEWSNMPSYNYFKVDNYDTTPTGIKIASGSGTEDDPFIFELVFD